MGSPAADGQTVPKDVGQEQKPVDHARSRRVLDALRTSLAKNSDRDVFIRCMEMLAEETDMSLSTDEMRKRAANSDFERFQKRGLLPSYVEQIYGEHQHAPVK
jgi:hypothetical protein